MKRVPWNSSNKMDLNNRKMKKSSTLPCCLHKIGKKIVRDIVIIIIIIIINLSRQ